MKAILKHLESPFGFIKGFQLEAKSKENVEEKKQALEEKKKEALLNWELSPEM